MIGRPASGPSPSDVTESPLPPPVPEGQAIPLGVKPIRWYHHTRASLVLLVLVLLICSIVYPLIVTGMAALLAPGTAAGQQWITHNQSAPVNGTNATATSLAPSPAPLVQGGAAVVGSAGRLPGITACPTHTVTSPASPMPMALVGLPDRTREV